MAKKRQSASAQDLDKLIHEKARLGIMTTLAAHPDGILFTDLKRLTDLTDGNLNRHLKVLGDADLLTFRKSAGGRNSRTTYQLTRRGLRQFMAYLEQMEQVLERATAATRSARHASGSRGRLARE